VTVCRYLIVQCRSPPHVGCAPVKQCSTHSGKAGLAASRARRRPPHSPISPPTFGELEPGPGSNDSGAGPTPYLRCTPSCSWPPTASSLPSAKVHLVAVCRPTTDSISTSLSLSVPLCLRHTFPGRLEICFSHPSRPASASTPGRQDTAFHLSTHKRCQIAIRWQQQLGRGLLSVA
jgi:hypothetical protein